MASPTELEAWLADVTWRPGWTLRIGIDTQSFDYAGQLRVSGPVLDSYDGRQQVIGHTFGLHAEAFATRTDFYGWLLDCLQRVDMHECSEFFTVKGAHVADPHHLEGRYTGEIIPSVLAAALLGQAQMR